MDIHQIMQSIGEQFYMVFSAVSGWLNSTGSELNKWFAANTAHLSPSFIKVFGNKTMSKSLLVIFMLYLILINIIALRLFALDKKRALQRRERIPEKKLIRISVFGGALGAFIAMEVYRHKTQKRKFGIIPVLFFIQLILNSFIFGFLGFWVFL